MRKDITFKIVFCAILAALSVFFNLFTIQMSVIVKLTFYGLPLMVSGLVFNYKWGFICGFVSGLVIQITSPYGITLTTPLWMLAPICWGTFSGIIKVDFKKKSSVLFCLLIVIMCSVTAHIANTMTMFVDVYLYGNEYYTYATILVGWPNRLINMAVMIIPFTICLSSIGYAYDNYLNKT